MTQQHVDRTGWTRLGHWVLGSLFSGLILGLPVVAEELFIEVGPESGFDFIHWNGMAGELHFVEMMGPGGALADFDGDGDLDIYIVQGASLGPSKPLAPPPGDGPPRDRLYLNKGSATGGGLRFRDVTTKSGLDALGYGQGAATGDVDNDGDMDLYVANFGANELWLNQGPGSDGVPRFEDATAQAEVGDERWSVGASFVDFDRDGWLDLYVVDYVDYRLENNVKCYAPSSRRDYCGPDAFPPVADRLYRNLGADAEGRVAFTEVSGASGIAQAAAPGLGVVAFDVDDDRWLDIFVANDGRPNQLWLNGRNGRFTDDALLLGVAVNRQGRPEASMGVAVADIDGDGDEDLFMTHLLTESNTLYLNQGGFLDDRTRESNLEGPSLPFTAFGTGWVDVDHDGWLDLVVVNGAVRVLEDQAQAGEVLPLAQSNQLFHSVPAGPGSSGVGRRFEDWSGRAGEVFARPEVSRGAAFGDVDNDGDVDLLVLNNNGPARLLLNRGAEGGERWMGLRLLTGTEGTRRDALGARVRLDTEGQTALWRRVATDGSFGCAGDPRVTMAVGSATPTGLWVGWPDGREEMFEVPPSGRYTTLVQGAGHDPKTAGDSADDGTKNDGAANGGKNTEAER